MFAMWYSYSTSGFARLLGLRPQVQSITENAKFAGPSDRRGYFLSGSGKHPSITGPCDRLIVHCSPFLPHACAKLHLQWVCQKASGSAKNLVSAGPVVWHIKKSFRILCYHGPECRERDWTVPLWTRGEYRSEQPKYYGIIPVLDSDSSPQGRLS